jgi:AraC-like DNA-binding protein
MQQESSLPNLVPEDHWAQIEAILQNSEILVLTCLFWWMDIPHVMKPRTLADSLLYFPVQGRIRCRVGSETAVLGPGDFLMVPEGVEHEAHRVEEPDEEIFKAYSIHAHAYTAQNRPLLGLFRSPLGRLPGPEGWFQQLALLTHMLGKNRETGEAFGEILVRNILLQQLIEGNPLASLPVADDVRVWTAVLHILRHFREPLHVPRLARQAGISEVQLRKLFNRDIGVPPGRYIQQVRLRKARALLQTNPRITVKEVAEQTGFTDAHYFHAVFKQEYGATPGEYRKTSPGE